MIFKETPLRGAFMVSLEPLSDERGCFARAYCAREFGDRGIAPLGVQCNLVGSRLRGTVRGLHYQVPPATEAKLVRCIHGANYHVIVDLRPESPSYRQHFGIELSRENRLALYVPELFAHGYQSLADDAEVLYLVGTGYTPECERGLRYDDPALGIRWPLPVTRVSEKDSSWPLLESR